MLAENNGQPAAAVLLRFTITSERSAQGSQRRRGCGLKRWNASDLVCEWHPHVRAHTSNKDEQPNCAQ